MFQQMLLYRHRNIKDSSKNATVKRSLDKFLTSASRWSCRGATKPPTSSSSRWCRWLKRWFHALKNDLARPQPWTLATRARNHCCYRKEWHLLDQTRWHLITHYNKESFNKAVGMDLACPRTPAKMRISSSLEKNNLGKLSDFNCCCFLRRGNNLQ